jgi:hypothetical protein
VSLDLFVQLLQERRRRDAEAAAADARRLAAEEAERQRVAKAERAGQDRWREVAAELRAELFEKQGVFWSPARRKSLAKRLAALCSRRAGKTKGGANELIAYALENPKSRQLYVNETRDEAKALLWDEADDGILAVLDRFGFVRGERKNDRNADYVANETELVVRFRNGAIIKLFGVNDERQANKLRGRKWHRVWIDEAQKLPHLETLIKRVLGASMRDFKGEVILTGTPGIDCAGYFYEVTRNDPDPSVAGQWEVHRWSTRDNVFFGRVVPRVVELDDGAYDVVDQFGTIVSTHETLGEAEAAAVDLRWRATALAALEENGWSEDDPDFLREWGGEWVRENARYVYAVNKLTHDELVFAPMRTNDDGLYDHAASMLDLPRRPDGREYEWGFALGADDGFDPDPFAVVLWAFTTDLPDLWEMWSWKKTEQYNDDIAGALQQIMAQAPLSVAVMDAGAISKRTVTELRVRYHLPILPAEKQHKLARIKAFNTDVRKRRVHFRGTRGVVTSAASCSPLLWEMVNLVYLPNVGGDAEPKINKHRRLPDKTVPGDHCCDSGIYSHWHCRHYLYEPEDEKPKPGTPEHDHAAEAALIERIEAEDAQEEWDYEYE